MKKLLFASFLVLSSAFVLPQSAQAYEENIDGFDCRAANTHCAKERAQAELNKAIRIRYRNDFYERLKNREYKNIYSQQFRNRAGKAIIKVSDRSTIADRSGALKHVPFYDQRKAVNQGNYSVSNNPKQNWKRAAIQYYVDGDYGYTSRTDMQEGIILGSQHRVRRVPAWFVTKAEPSKRFVRAEQKLQAAIADNEVNKVYTGNQKGSRFMGFSRGKNFFAGGALKEVKPWGIDNPAYLRTLRHLMEDDQ